MMSENGVHSIAYAFPKVRLVTTAIEAIIPGLGNFGDRYYGTDAVDHSSSDDDELEDDDQNSDIDVQSRSSSMDSAINSGSTNEVVREMTGVVTA